MKYIRFYVHIFFLFFYIHSATGYQGNELESKEDSYQFLASKFYANEKDTVTATVFANRYLIKAKRDNDTIRIADGYYFLSNITSRFISHMYSDSIITITKNHNTRSYPTYAYLNKAKNYYVDGDFKKAFDYFLKLNEEAEKHENVSLQYFSKKNIGIIKAILGENETALVTLRECYKFYSAHKNQAPFDYLSTLFALSESYNFNKVLDSATFINRLGYKESIVLNNEEFKYYFVLNEGINHYCKKDYVAARDSLKIAIKEFKINGDKANLGQAYFYLGKTLSSLGYEEDAVEQHKKVDTIFQAIPQIIPESRESYEILINYYKNIGDQNNQLKYIERLLKVDSVLNSNYKYLIKNVVQNYDTPRLLSKKQEIINSLESEKRVSSILIASLFILSLVSVIFWIFNYQKRKKYKKRFDELYRADAGDKKENIKTSAIKEAEAISISEEIVTEILKYLESFEQDKDYLKHNITISDLAKKMNTNSKYLSRVINYYKKKSFSTYINELRIDYCIEKLKTDTKFIKYTVRAIAKEVGFNSSESFSKSFYKLKGIHPSYFIKELEKQLKL